MTSKTLTSENQWDFWSALEVKNTFKKKNPANCLVVSTFLRLAVGSCLLSGCVVVVDDDGGERPLLLPLLLLLPLPQKPPVPPLLLLLSFLFFVVGVVVLQRLQCKTTNTLEPIVR